MSLEDTPETPDVVPIPPEGYIVVYDIPITSKWRRTFYRHLAKVIESMNNTPIQMTRSSWFCYDLDDAKRIADLVHQIQGMYFIFKVQRIIY